MTEEVPQAKEKTGRLKKSLAPGWDGRASTALELGPCGPERSWPRLCTEAEGCPQPRAHREASVASRLSNLGSVILQGVRSQELAGQPLHPSAWRNRHANAATESQSDKATHRKRTRTHVLQKQRATPRSTADGPSEHLGST